MKYQFRKSVFIVAFLSFLLSSTYVAANKFFVPAPATPKSAEEQKTPEAKKPAVPENKSEEGEALRIPKQNTGNEPAREEARSEKPAQPAAQEKKQAEGDSNTRPSLDMQDLKQKNADANHGMAEDSKQAEEKKQATMPDKADKSAKATRQTEPGETLSLAKLGALRNDVSNKELVIPDNVKNMNFLEGGWSFDHVLEGADGEKLNADFFFDKNGNGYSMLKNEKGEQFLAQVSAKAEDGTLKIVTAPYTSSQSSKVYGAEFIECSNGAKGAECRGTDGFTFWNGEHIVRSGKENRELMEETRSAERNIQKSGTVRQTGDESSWRQFSSTTTTSSAASSTAGTAQSEENFAELSGGGAEVSPIVMENTEKAQAGASGPSLASLNGDWRYSYDLTKHADGSSLSLGFHFDKNGKGYSSIQDSSGLEFRAPAEAELTKNGSIRVKTESYQNDKSQQGFFPTFMECKGSKDLICDVSNGWMRLNDGRLLSAKSLENQEKQVKAEDVKREARRQSMQDILGDMPTGEESRTQSSAQSSSQSASARNSAASSQAASSGKELSLSETNNSLDFLKGSWRCNTGLVRNTDKQPVVVEFSFDNQGKGEAYVRELSGQVFKAAAQATLKNSVLRINTSDFHNRNTPRKYEKSFIECKDSGAKAICAGKNGGISWSGATFTRLK